MHICIHVQTIPEKTIRHLLSQEMEEHSVLKRHGQETVYDRESGHRINHISV